MLEATRKHWPEYLIEAWGLGTFMVSACIFGVVFFHPRSPFAGLDHILRNALMGAAMGATAVGIFCSRWGMRPGAHINSSVTLAFWRLGKIRGRDACFYMLAQFAGAGLGGFLSRLALGEALEDAAVRFVVPVPGQGGAGAAFLAEFAISFLMMLAVLVSGSSMRLSRWIMANALRVGDHLLERMNSSGAGSRAGLCEVV